MTALTTLQPVAPLGAQRPRLGSAPAYLSSAGTEAIELAANAGLVLDPWQEHVLVESLGEQRGGKWSAFEVAVVVPRQNGKGSILEARELAGLFLFGEQLILHTAHEFKTAVEAFRRILRLVDANDSLRKRVKRVSTSHGDEGIELITGQRLRFVARTRGSGRGFTGDTIILDEAYALSPESIAALLPTLSARPNPQLWYASSAGMPESVQLARIRERALAGTGRRLAYFEWSAPDRAALGDRDAWAQANPALGIRIDLDSIEAEYDAMPEAEFARERLGIWDDPRHAAVIDPELWATLADRHSQLVDPVAFALEVDPDRKHASIAAAGARRGGGLHVELIANRPGASWAVDQLVELTARQPNVGVAIDAGSGAAALVPALTAAGVTVTFTGARDMASACGRFYDACHETHTDRRLHHLNAAPLNLALSQAKQRPLGDAWAWQRRNLDADITPIVAVTLALHLHTTHEPTKPAVPLYAF